MKHLRHAAILSLGFQDLGFSGLYRVLGFSVLEFQGFRMFCFEELDLSMSRDVRDPSRANMRLTANKFECMHMKSSLSLLICKQHQATMYRKNNSIIELFLL